MRVLLTSGASYAPPRGGSTRSNLAWLRRLAGNGHSCRVVCPAIEGGPGCLEQDGIAISRIPDLTRQAFLLGSEIRDFEPDWVLVSSEDVSHVLLREAERAVPGRVIYLAHTPQFFPFGPESWNPDPVAARILRRCAGVVAIGHHMADYVERHAGMKADVIHPPIYGDPPFPRFGAGGLVLMINPCTVKGIEIFLAMAERFPQSEFGALLGWGTTTADRAALCAFRNIALLQNAPDIDDILAQARLLLMPSIWYEGFGLIVMEAMLRGLPVISSDSGGLVEAKQGTEFVIPVNPVQRYEMIFDENHMPKPVSGPQNLAAWEAALRTLLTDETAYQNEAGRSREAALRFVASLHADQLERYLCTRPAPSERELLLQRLRQKSAR